MPERRRVLVVLAGAAALLAVLLVYSRWASRTLVRDDEVLVAETAPFRTGSPVALFTKPFWPEGALGDARPRYYRPIVLLSLRADAALGGSPVEFHRTNVLLHVLACLMLALAARRLGASGASAVVAALVWGLAPRLTESVAWVSGRTDVLAGLFVFAALALSPDVPVRPAPGDRRGRALAVASGLCLFAALASKEVAVAGVAALVALAWHRRRVEDGTPLTERLVRLGLGVALPCGVYAVLRSVALAGTSATSRDLGLVLRSLTVLEAIGRYVEMTADALRPRTVIGLVGHVDWARVSLGAVTLLVAGLLVVRRARAGRRSSSDGLVTAGVLGVVALGVVVHIIPLATAGSIVSDRCLYLPFAALALAAAVAASGLKPMHRSVVCGAAIALAIPFAMATRARAHDYDDEARFWLVAAETGHPANVTPRNALANVLMTGGRADLGCAMFESARAIEETTSQQKSPVHRRTREGLAGCLAKIGRYEEAAIVTDQLVADHPDFGRGHLARGFAYLHLLAFDDAQASFERAGALEPALARYTAEPLAEVARARIDAPRYVDPAVRAADVVGYAVFLQGVGRLPEAEGAMLVIALDPTASPTARLSAVRFLARYGDLDKARAASSSFEFDGITTSMLALRQRRHDAIVVLLPRITELLGNPETRSRPVP